MERDTSNRNGVGKFTGESRFRRAANNIPISRTARGSEVINVSLVDRFCKPSPILEEYIKRSPRMRFNQCYEAGKLALQKLGGNPVEVILIQQLLPDMCGIECAHCVRKLCPKSTIIILAAEPDLLCWLRAMRAGAEGFFVLPGTLISFQIAVSEALEGWKPFSREIQKLIVERLTRTPAIPSADAMLSPGEHDVMSYLILGMSDKEIASRRGTATATIHSITHNIYKKLGVHGRDEAVGVYLGLREKKEPPPVPDESTVRDCPETALRPAPNEYSERTRLHF